MRCTPAAVLSTMGQMLEMKITQIAAGFAALNTSRPIGSHASGDTGRNRLITGAAIRPRNCERPMTKPTGMPMAAARSATTRLACASGSLAARSTTALETGSAILVGNAATTLIVAPSSGVDLEGAGVGGRRLAVPDDAVDELRCAHRLFGQRDLHGGRRLRIDVDAVHLLRDGEIVRILFEQPPATVLRHEPHAVGEVREAHRAIVEEAHRV